MAKVSKKRKAADALVDRNNLYSLGDAMAKVKEANTTKFDASVDIHIRMGIDPRKADQALRGTVSLPHGTGKTKRVLVLCTPDKEEEAKEAGADFVGMDDLAEQSVDELMEISDLDKDAAGKLIMTARIPWFESEESSDEDND